MVVTCFWILQFSIFRKWSYRRKLDGELEDAEQKVPEIRKTDNNVCELSMIQEPATNGVKRMMETMEILMTLERSYELITSMPTVVFLRQSILVTIFLELELELLQQSSLKVWPGKPQKQALGMVEGTTTATAVLPPEPVPSGFTAERSPLQEDTLLLFFFSFFFPFSLWNIDLNVYKLNSLQNKIRLMYVIDVQSQTVEALFSQETRIAC